MAGKIWYVGDRTLPNQKKTHLTLMVGGAKILIQSIFCVFVVYFKPTKRKPFENQQFDPKTIQAEVFIPKS